MAALHAERGERAWLFLHSLTCANERPLPRYVTGGFLSGIFKVTPYTAKAALGALKGQPKGQPWPPLADVIAKVEAEASQ